MNGDVTPEQRPDRGPADNKYWDEAAAKASVSELSDVRAAAEKWAGTVATLLGVFSTVAVVAGPDKLTDVEDQFLRVVLLLAIVAAGLAAIGSVVTASNAMKNSVGEVKDWDGSALRAHVRENADKARDDLGKSRFWGTLAAFLVFAVGIAAAGASILPKDEQSTKVLVVDNSGAIRCGALATAEDGTVTVAGQQVVAAAQPAVVDSC